MSPRTGRPKSENPKQNNISVRLTDSEMKRLETYCKANDKQKASTIRKAILDFLEVHEKK